MQTVRHIPAPPNDFLQKCGKCGTVLVDNRGPGLLMEWLTYEIWVFKTGSEVHLECLTDDYVDCSTEPTLKEGLCGPEDSGSLSDSVESWMCQCVKNNEDHSPITCECSCHK